MGLSRDLPPVDPLVERRLRPLLSGSLIGSLEEKAVNDGRLPEWPLVGAAGLRAGGRQRARSNGRLAALPWGRGLAVA